MSSLFLWVLFDFDRKLVNLAAKRGVIPHVLSYASINIKNVIV